MRTQDFDVLLLAAGFGTRLRPLTDTTPKALISVGGKPLIQRHLERLAEFGVRRVIINVHYLAEQIVEFVGDGKRFGLEAIFSREDPILDSGGAVKRIAPLLEQDLLLTINSDILLGPDFTFQSALDKQRRENCLATLCLRPDPDSARYGEIAVLEDGRVVDYLGRRFVPGPWSPRRLMYLGVAVLSPKVQLYAAGFGDVFSITRDLYPATLAGGEVISSVTYGGYWSDVGTLSSLQRAQNEVREIFGIS